MDEKEIIWGLVKDNFEQARSHERFRADVTKLVLILTGILAAAMSVEGIAEPGKQFIYAAIGIVGVFGAIANAKHYERFSMHIHIAQKFIDLFQEKDDKPIDFNERFIEFQKGRLWSHSWLASFSLNWLWTGLPALIGIVGLVLLAL